MLAYALSSLTYSLSLCLLLHCLPCLLAACALDLRFHCIVLGAFIKSTKRISFFSSLLLLLPLLLPPSSGHHKIKLNTQIIFVLIFIKFLWPSHCSCCCCCRYLSAGLYCPFLCRRNYGKQIKSNNSNTHSHTLAHNKRRQ